MGSLFDVQQAEPQDGSRCQKLWTSWQTSWSCWGQRSMKRLICSLWKNKDSSVKMQTFNFLICCIWGQRYVGTLGAVAHHRAARWYYWDTLQNMQGPWFCGGRLERCSAVTGYTCSQWSDKCWQVPEIISRSLCTDIKQDVCEECAALNTSASHKITSLIHSRSWCAVNGADFKITLL